MKYLLVLSLLIVLPVTSCAQVNTLPDPKPSFAAIIVSNMKNSIEWYSEKLGFKVLNQMESEERGFKQANLKRGSAHIELIALRNSIAPKDILAEKPKGTRISGYFKFGFLVQAFDDWVDALTRSNVEFHGRVVKDDISGKRMLIIKDPDGNRIQLFEE